jgi:hypothetical protein
MKEATMERHALRDDYQRSIENSPAWIAQTDTRSATIRRYEFYTSLF